MATLYQLLRSRSNNRKDQHSSKSQLIKLTQDDALVAEFPMEASGMARSIPWNNLEFEFSEGNQCNVWMRLPYANYEYELIGKRMCDDGKYYHFVAITFIVPDYLRPFLEPPGS